MKAAIIGANSYIARNLIRKLRETRPDCELKLYDWAEKQLDGEAEYRSVRVLDRVSVARVDLDCDVIYMFVGKTGSAGGFKDYDAFIDINERALLNLLDACRERNSSAKLVFPSTRLVYRGSPNALSESAPKEFKTIYAMNKFACENYLAQYSRMYGLRYCVFRICIPYGSMIPAASSYGTIEFMLKKAASGENISLYGDGSVRRTFTHIEDLCENMIDGAFLPECVNEIYNIGGEDMSLEAAAEQIAALFHVKVEHVAYPEEAGKIETGDTVFDASKLAALGIAPRRRFSAWISDLERKSGGGYSEHRIAVILPLPSDELQRDQIRSFIEERYRPKRRAA